MAKEEGNEKAAPWRAWEAVPVTAKESARPRDRPVAYLVEEYGPDRNARYSELISDAAWAHFHISRALRPDEDLAAYVSDGQLRLVYKELIVRFAAGVESTERDRILRHFGFDVLDRSPYTRNEWIVCHRSAEIAGKRLLETADELAARPEVVFAWPDSVSEFERAASADRHWHLNHIQVNDGRGHRDLLAGNSNVVVAVVDDGVDLDHPNLKGRLCTAPDPAEPLDSGGRDFNFLKNQLAHFDPRAKLLPPLGSSGANDHHGTQCAGLIVSDGTQGGYMGVAPGCRFISVRAVNGAQLVSDKRFAAALCYAARVASIISCSLTGSTHRVITRALNGAVAQSRGGKGTAVFCATGNHAGAVKFPASHQSTIAVGACTDAGDVPGYSNFGPEVDFVAPSHGGQKAVFTTDVSQAGKGDSPTSFWGEFGGTSAATAIAAGVGALCLSVNPNLTRNELRELLRETTDKLGALPYNNGRNHKFGYGRINAAKAVAAAGTQ